MFSGILVFVGHFFEELSASASKHSFKERVLTYTLFGFISHIVSSVFFFGMIFATKSDFVYNTEALPLFFARLALEIIQCEIIYRAFVKSDRTAFGFARILTIPLLLLVDIALGYQLTNGQFIGIGIISAALLAYFSTEQHRGKGVYLALISSVLSVISISLFKYDVSHYNSAGVSQFVMASTMTVIFGVRVALSKTDRKHLLKIKEHPLLGLTFLSQGFAGVLITYAYTFVPASLALALSRASAVIWSLLSGVFYFHEKKVLRKVFVCAILAIGLFVMVK